MRRPAAPIFYVDTETTGLTRPYLVGGRRIYDYGHVCRHPNGLEDYEQWFVSTKDLPFDPFANDLDQETRRALNIGRFYQRHPEATGGDMSRVIREADLAERVAAWYGSDDWPAEQTGWPAPARPYLVGCVPTFEDLGLADLLIRHGHIESEAPWHYRLICAENLAAGRLRVGPGWNPDDLARRLGLDPARYDRHTAIADAEFARDLYDAVLGHTPARRARLAAARAAKRIGWQRAA